MREVRHGLGLAGVDSNPVIGPCSGAAAIVAGAPAGRRASAKQAGDRRTVPAEARRDRVRGGGRCRRKPNAPPDPAEVRRDRIRGWGHRRRKREVPRGSTRTVAGKRDASRNMGNRRDIEVLRPGMGRESLLQDRCCRLTGSRHHECPPRRAVATFTLAAMLQRRCVNPVAGSGRASRGGRA